MKKEEYLILVDQEDNPIGQMEKHLAHQLNKKHRAFSVFLLDQDNNMILQKRAENKYHSAGLWTNACCGHPRPGEQTKDAAIRRSLEELGIQVNIQEIFSLSYEEHLKNGLWENEFDHIFMGNYSDSDFNINKEEISELKTMSLNEIEDDIKVNPEAYTYWFKLIIPRIKTYIR